MLRRHRAVLALVVWTFLVWTTRIGNILRDEDLDTAGRVGRTALALAFTAMAITLLFGVVRQAPWLRRAVEVVALATVVFWVVQGLGILVRDHELGFKVVHTILAVGSIVLAALAWRESLVREPERAGHPG
jgi:hypothetical protein